METVAPPQPHEPCRAVGYIWCAICTGHGSHILCYQLSVTLLVGMEHARLGADSSAHHRFTPRQVGQHQNGARVLAEFALARGDGANQYGR